LGSTEEETDPQKSANAHRAGIKKLLYWKKYCDSIQFMQRKIMHIGRISFLFLYAMYALTPVHLYEMEGCSEAGPGRLLTGKHISADIVWANVLFSSFVDEDVDSSPSSEGSRISTGAQQSSDMVLLRKRRALFREQSENKPQFDIKILPPGDLEVASFRFAEYQTAKAPFLRETDSYLVLNTGLSPPSSLLS
jgi:hypothetical protein